MAQSEPAPRHLYAELEALPTNVVGEIISGSLYAHPRPARPHGRAASRLHGTLSGPFDLGVTGPGGWMFIVEQELHLGDNVVVPDISGWKVERYPASEATPYTAVAPDWLCEVLSPSTVQLDRTQKLRLYAEHGVPYCWYVDPIAKTLEVFVLSGKIYSVGATFAENERVTAPPFEAQPFDLGLLWDRAP